MINCDKDIHVWSDILRLVKYHLDTHPSFSVRDAYKLLYQHFFGPEHFVMNKDDAWRRLVSEISEIEPDATVPLIEPLSIDCAIFRINLAPFKALNLDLEKLFAAFIESVVKVDESAGDMFAASWMALIQEARDGKINLNADEMEDFVRKGILKSGLSVHHSEEYMRLNHPAYRVVCRKAFLKHFPEMKNMLLKSLIQ
jgi:hypothetical protein